MDFPQPKHWDNFPPPSPKAEIGRSQKDDLLIDVHCKEYLQATGATEQLKRVKISNIRPNTEICGSLVLRLLRKGRHSKNNNYLKKKTIFGINPLKFLIKTPNREK